MASPGSSKSFGVGVIGAGNIGTQVVKLLKQQGPLDNGSRLSVLAVADRHPEKLKLWDGMKKFSGPDELIRESDVNIVVETAGGAENGKEIIIRALEAGKHVVTANKAAICKYGEEIFHAAKWGGLFVGFEASVCAEIPIIDYLMREPNRKNIAAVRGLVNGTTNFILTSMAEGMDYRAALALAQARGFAERDPSFDVDNNDAAQKLAILASLAFGGVAKETDVRKQGIGCVSVDDIKVAGRFGYSIKSVAEARRHPGGIELSVGPALVRTSRDLLAAVKYEKNAVALHFDQEGRTEPIMMSGMGAGGVPTARAICRDIAAIANGSMGRPAAYVNGEKMNILDFGQSESEYYMRIGAANTPGSAAMIMTILAQAGISIKNLHQRAGNGGTGADFLPVHIFTYTASGKQIEKAVETMESVRDKVVEPPIKDITVMRVEG